MREGATGVGYTFETLLGKQEDYFPIPDYEGIEIKTMRYFSKHKIHLFNAMPDGDFLFPIKRVIDNLGYPDKLYPEYKVFTTSIKANEFKNLRSKKVKLFVNWEEEKIDLLAYTYNNQKIDIHTSWSFKLLQDSLFRKLNYLAIIKACSKKINGEEYLLYGSASYYKLKDFNTFLKLIENGTITITFKISIYKDKENLGKIYNRGTDFSIFEKDIELLFNKIIL